MEYKHHLFEKKQTRGFTLIELMVVISILAVLSIVGLTTYSHAQSIARDKKRIQDLHMIASALILYYQANHHYPGPDFTFAFGGIPSISYSGECTSTSCNPPWIAGLDSKYISQIPVDPTNTINNHAIDPYGQSYPFYVYVPGGTRYCDSTGNDGKISAFLLATRLENTQLANYSTLSGTPFTACNKAGDPYPDNFNPPASAIPHEYAIIVNQLSIGQ